MPSKEPPTVTTEKGVTVISLGSDYENLDEWDLDPVRKAILDATKDPDPPFVLIDLSKVKFFASSFIELLFRVWNRMKTLDGGRFAICGLTPYCAEILEVTHLNQLWEIHDTKEEAIDSLLSK